MARRSMTSSSATRFTAAATWRASRRWRPVCPSAVPAMTIDTQCCAGLDAVMLAAARIDGGRGVRPSSRAVSRVSAVRPSVHAARSSRAKRRTLTTRPPFTPWPERDPDMIPAAAALARTVGADAGGARGVRHRKPPQGAHGAAVSTAEIVEIGGPRARRLRPAAGHAPLRAPAGAGGRCPPRRDGRHHGPRGRRGGGGAGGLGSARRTARGGRTPRPHPRRRPMRRRSGYARPRADRRRARGACPPRHRHAQTD